MRNEANFNLLFQTLWKKGFRSRSRRCNASMEKKTKNTKLLKVPPPRWTPRSGRCIQPIIFNRRTFPDHLLPSQWFNYKCNKKTWETLNIYFSNKLQFEQKLYYYRPGLTTSNTKMRVVGMRPFIFWLKQEKPLALDLWVNCWEILIFLTIFARKGYYL